MGYHSESLIYRDLVIVASQAPNAGVVAFEKLTGKIKWTTPPLGLVGYVSPTIVKVSGEDHVVMITASGGRRGAGGGEGKVVGIDPLSGKILWEYNGWQCVIPVPSPVDAGQGRILITGGYEAGSAMIHVECKSDGGYSVTELFKNVDFGAHTISPILYKDHFYAHYSTNERKDGLVCMSIDGEIRWKTRRSPLFDNGSMILADGLILSTDGRTKLYLIEPNPAGFKELASAELFKIEESSDPMMRRFGDQNWAPEALADDKLLIRDQQRLLCIKIAQ